MTLRAPLLAILALILAAPSRAEDPLARVRQALGQLHGSTAIEASIERRLVREQKDRPNISGTATAHVSAGTDGLKLTLPSTQLAPALAEKLNLDPDAPRPASSAITSVDLTDVALELNAANALLHDLDGAIVKHVEGNSIELELKVRLPKADAANVKEAKSSAKLVIAPDGTPVSLEKRTSLHGRIMLMSIDIVQTESTAYAVHGDRLVVTREQRINDTEGLGQKAHEDRVTTLQVE